MLGIRIISELCTGGVRRPGMIIDITVWPYDVLIFLLRLRICIPGYPVCISNLGMHTATFYPGYAICISDMHTGAAVQYA